MMHNMQLSNYLVKNPKKHLIFDFDRTIVKIEMDWSQYRNQLMKIYRQFNPQYQRSALSGHESYNNFVKTHGVKVVELVKVFRQRYERKMNRGFTPNKELIEFIKNANEYKKYVYSNNSRPTVLKGLRELELDNLFDQIVTCDEVIYTKPDPEGFKLIYDSSVPKSEYLMIGDSSADQKMAEAAGIDFYLVAYFKPIF